MFAALFKPRKVPEKKVNEITVSGQSLKPTEVADVDEAELVDMDHMCQEASTPLKSKKPGQDNGAACEVSSRCSVS